MMKISVNQVNKVYQKEKNKNRKKFYNAAKIQIQEKKNIYFKKK